jgi:hypothetical protein
MNYDFAQIVKVDGSEVRVMFTCHSESRENGKAKKILAGVDEMGGAYSAIGVNDCMDKTIATQVTRS